MIIFIGFHHWVWAGIVPFASLHEVKLENDSCISLADICRVGVVSLLGWISNWAVYVGQTGSTSFLQLALHPRNFSWFTRWSQVSFECHIYIYGVSRVSLELMEHLCIKSFFMVNVEDFSYWATSFHGNYQRLSCEAMFIGEAWVTQDFGWTDRRFTDFSLTFRWRLTWNWCFLCMNFKDNRYCNQHVLPDKNLFSFIQLRIPKPNWFVLSAALMNHEWEATALSSGWVAWFVTTFFCWKCGRFFDSNARADCLPVLHSHVTG